MRSGVPLWGCYLTVENGEGVDCDLLTDGIVDAAIANGLTIGGGGDATKARYYVTYSPGIVAGDTESPVRPRFSRMADRVRMLEGVTQVKMGRVRRVT